MKSDRRVARRKKAVPVSAIPDRRAEHRDPISVRASEVRQQPKESVDAFYARLKELVIICMLSDVDDEIRAQFMQGCSSVKLMEIILQVPGMSMDGILKLGRSRENSKACTAHMEAPLYSPNLLT
ncbi:hypothetical protein NDU88_004997 [Pleurodeles waltl]|uniref:Gag-pol polyprotein n=1 Tax=Pleurodeles waltl TaxID=8319 RepID=A0AAV7TT37_PLEWA|nr:hypothetical protein NDU88_004997 [Pleurodeles waltl]